MEARRRMHAVGTLLLAGIGAFIANFAAKFVEAQVRRSQVGETQRDADLQDLVVAAGLLGALSEKFWTKSATELGTEDQILRSHLMAQQHNIAELVNSLFSGENKWDCDVQVHALFKAATGGNFGDENREAEPGRLTEILIAVHSLVHKAKAARRNIKRHFLA